MAESVPISCEDSFAVVGYSCVQSSVLADDCSVDSLHVQRVRAAKFRQDQFRHTKYEIKMADNYDVLNWADSGDGTPSSSDALGPVGPRYTSFGADFQVVTQKKFALVMSPLTKIQRTVGISIWH